MKKFLLIIILVSSQIVEAQTPIPITAVGDEKSRSIKIDKEIKKSLIPGGLYQIVVNGVNPAHTSLKVRAKSKEIYTPLPKVLETVFAGTPGSIIPSKYLLAKNSEDLYNFIDGKARNLATIKKLAESLHEISLFQPTPDSAQRRLDAITKLYKDHPQNKAHPLGTENHIAGDIQFLTSFKDYVDNLMEKEPSNDPEFIRLHSTITTINNDLKKNDYQAYFSYIQRSVKKEEVNFIESKPFTASKDLVELKIILTDTFTKDTLANETRTVFTRGGNLGLSFSTGFFYTELLSDKPYYLQARADEKVAVKSDQRTVSDLSIGGLAHIYYKATPSIRIGPALGLSISPFDGKSRYLLGGSLLLGKEKMVGINAGWAWAKIKELSSIINSDDQGLYLAKGTSAVPTKDKIENVLFVGLTYNLISTRK